MGITKQYLRFAPAATFGIIAAPTHVSFISLRETVDRFLITSACENVYIWDTRTSEKVRILHGDKHEVTAFTKSKQNLLAVGYSDGTIRLFDISTGDCNVTFSGHKSAVTCLEFNADGVCLVSGSKDTDIVMWDVVNESGMFRLKGHKGVVTRCHFMKTANILVSGSKDSLVKFWDLDTQHCFKTLIGHRSEIWDFVLLKNDTRLITGTGDSELRVFNIEFVTKTDGLEQVMKKSKQSDEDKHNNSEDEEENVDILAVTKLGSVMRQGKDRVFRLHTDISERLLGCHGSDYSLEVFKLCTEDEVKKHVQKRMRKERKRLRSEANEQQEEFSEQIAISTLADEIRRLTPLKASSKLRGFDAVVREDGSVKIAALLNNNAVELYSVSSLEKEATGGLIKSLSSLGHRSDVRTMSFSSDNIAVLSASGESTKIWNRESQRCICTVACEYALCSLFTPGDRHFVIGTKTGKLQIFDLSAGSLLEAVHAHDGPVWSIALFPDMRGIVSGSEDKDVKFWEFELIKDEENSTTKRLTLIHKRTLKMSEGIVAVKISPDQRLLAVSLLDSTVKIFFMDTLKFFLSLYGHKFPVLAMDISYDSTLIATGSADRNVKIWGLDFGDCHKSIFAHDDSIMCLQFLPKTHMFFTGSKDKTIKQWDADNFQKVTTLKGHHGEVWALACSPDGQYLVSGSHDKSIRLWKKTDEILVLSEELEMEREAEFEKDAVGEETVVPGETNKETGLAAKKTVESLKATEKLVESIDVYNEEMAKLEEHKQECLMQGKELPPPEPNPLFSVYNTTSPLRYMLEVFRRIKSSELEQSLLTLPFNYSVQFLKILSEFLDKGWEVELTCRSLFFLLRIHHGQISTSRSLLHVIDKLRTTTMEKLSEVKDTIGFNLAGLTYLQREIDSREEVALFADATLRFREKKKRRKKAVPILAN